MNITRMQVSLKWQRAGRAAGGQSLQGEGKHVIAHVRCNLCATTQSRARYIAHEWAGARALTMPLVEARAFCVYGSMSKPTEDGRADMPPNSEGRDNLSGGASASTGPPPLLPPPPAPLLLLRRPAPAPGASSSASSGISKSAMAAMFSAVCDV